jgi:hypothetical protein
VLPRPRVWTLLAMVLAFWVLTALSRAHISTPVEGRYIYAGALLVLLLGVELLRGVALPAWAGWALAVAAVFAAVSNLGDLRIAAGYLRGQAAITRADLAAAELARAVVSPAAELRSMPGFPFVRMRAIEYLATARALGSPADTVSRLAGAPEGAREVADAELVRLERLALVPGGDASGGSPPAVERAVGGTATPRGGCVRFRPAAATPGATPPALELALPRGGLVLTSAGGEADVKVRRFAAAYPAGALARLDHGTAILRAPADPAPQPWHVRIAPAGDLVACGLPAPGGGGAGTPADGG